MLGYFLNIWFTVMYDVYRTEYTNIIFPILLTRRSTQHKCIITKERRKVSLLYGTCELENCRVVLGQNKSLHFMIPNTLFYHGKTRNKNWKKKSFQSCD